MTTHKYTCSDHDSSFKLVTWLDVRLYHSSELDPIVEGSKEASSDSDKGCFSTRVVYLRLFSCLK